MRPACLDFSVRAILPLALLLACIFKVRRVVMLAWCNTRDRCTLPQAQDRHVWVANGCQAAHCGAGGPRRQAHQRAEGRAHPEGGFR